jgi:hypothetical protein
VVGAGHPLQDPRGTVMLFVQILVDVLDGHLIDWARQDVSH